MDLLWTGLHEKHQNLPNHIEALSPDLQITCPFVKILLIPDLLETQFSQQIVKNVSITLELQSAVGIGK